MRRTRTQVDAGADLLGLIFAAKSTRCVEVAQAKSIVDAVRARRPRPQGWTLPQMKARRADGKPVETGAESARWLQASQGLLARGAASGGPLCVGVFVDSTAEEMNRVAAEVGLDLIQLHGAEGWEVAMELHRPAVRVVHMEAGVSAEQVRAQLRGGLASAVLLDSKGGGTGLPFDWKVGGEVRRLGKHLD